MDNSNNYPQAKFLAVESSSNIAAIEYTPDVSELNSGILVITFHSGGRYEYGNFGMQLADEFFAAESKGRFFHSKIKNQFIGVKVEEVPEEPTETRFSRQREDEENAGATWPDPEDLSEVEKLQEDLNEDLPERYVQSVEEKLDPHHSMPNGNGQEF